MTDIQETPAPAAAPATTPASSAADDLSKYKVRVEPALYFAFPGLNFARQKDAGEITHNAMKKLVELCAEGAKIFDLCVKGDEMIEKATAAVYNKSVKGVKIAKGTHKCRY
jgi:hypothetical protein